jgi:tRNA nucleotidyltransferase (CCA-adding enzyme)
MGCCRVTSKLLPLHSISLSNKIQEQDIEDNWPLIMPPVLALLDDESTLCKSKGCELMTMILLKISPQLLARTGLGDVIQDAILPCLMYLPSVTPQAQALQLLSVAYPALLALSRAAYPTEKQRNQKMTFLGQVIRGGLLKGYSHCEENVYIVELLVKEMGLIVSEMGCWSASFLKVRLHLPLLLLIYVSH